jgi:DNA ligase-4
MLIKYVQITGGFISPLSISQVNSLLDELASNSGFSHRSIRDAYPKRARRGRLPVLKALFRSLSPVDASFLTQIILKDLRPVLYPIRASHYTSALVDFNTTSVQMLTKEHAMRVWDPTCWMLKAYRVKSTIDEAVASFSMPPHLRDANVPRIGIPVQVTLAPQTLQTQHSPYSRYQNLRKAEAALML